MNSISVENTNDIMFYGCTFGDGEMIDGNIHISYELKKLLRNLKRLRL